MARFKRDEDRRPVSGGVNLSDLLTPKSLLFDPVTNRLEVDLTIDAAISSVLPIHDKRDANRVPTSYAVSDIDLVTPLPILVDHNNNYILVNILFS